MNDLTGQIPTGPIKKTYSFFRSKSLSPTSFSPEIFVPVRLVVFIRPLSIILIVFFASLIPPRSIASRQPEKNKTLHFEKVIVDGQVNSPEVSIVTGDDDLDLPGLLRLRRNFLDQTINEGGEELK